MKKRRQSAAARDHGLAIDALEKAELVLLDAIHEWQEARIEVKKCEERLDHEFWIDKPVFARAPA